MSGAETGSSKPCPVCQNGGGRAFGSWANCPHGWAGWRASVERDIAEGRARYEAKYGPLPADIATTGGAET